MSDERLGANTEFEVLRIKDGKAEALSKSVATEVPCTIVVNGREVVTAMVTPTYLKEFAVGHLFTAGIVNSTADVTSYRCDETKWRLDLETTRGVDLELLGKRLYTSGCGKGVMYANVIELSSRQPLAAGPEVRAEALVACMKWLLSSSALFHATHGVHSVAISIAGDLPDLLIDDIGRHNAVDKIIGHGLLHGFDFSRGVLLSTGRTSSEILHKAKRAGIPIVLSRGAPTHQTVLLAREMDLAVASFGRSGGITVFSSRDRVLADR
jgi:FdhD protein